MLDDTSQAWIDTIVTGDTAGTVRLGLLLDTADTLDHTRTHHPMAMSANRYARHGIPVFPIAPKGKRPLCTHGFLDATTDTGQITEWWAKWPDANIGTPTGHLFDVIDIDGLEGMTSMYGNPDPIVDEFDVIAIASTSRDGGRHLYIPVTGRTNGTAIAPGVDFRGAGGYVVAPPSVGANGRRYQWITELGALT